MKEYLAFFSGKVESLVVGKETSVAYVEFHDGNKSLVFLLEPVAVGQFVLVGRRILFINPNTNPPTITTTDEIIQVLTDPDDRIYKEMKVMSDNAKKESERN